MIEKRNIQTSVVSVAVVSTIKNRNALIHYYNNNTAKCSITDLNIQNIFKRFLLTHSYPDFLFSPETLYKFRGDAEHDLNKNTNYISELFSKYPHTFHSNFLHVNKHLTS